MFTHCKKSLVSVAVTALLVATPAHGDLLGDLVGQAYDLAAGDGGGMATQRQFQRVATYNVYHNLAANEDPATETAAEIAAASGDGNTLLYTDSPQGRLGLVDITDPTAPMGLGFIQFSGEPTSVSVTGSYALVGINTSEDYVNVSGELAVVDISDPHDAILVRTIQLGGQPDSVAVSVDGRFAAIAIENERDEDACAAGDGSLIDSAYGDEDACDAAGGIFGGLPQLPSGYLVVVRTEGDPQAWTSSIVPMAGYASEGSIDAEPEFVDINANNLAAVTMQENNHLVVVDLETASVVSDFNVGTVDLFAVDTVEDELLEVTGDLLGVPREPDAVTWLDDTYLVTANEGDWKGGSRGFTVFDAMGQVQFDSASDFEYLVTSVGMYPEFRAENKGAEPEGAEFGQFGDAPLLFIGAERANLVGVYSVANPLQPELLQVLPTGIGPEGLLAIPSRDLFVVASEKDSADDGFRGALSIYQLQDAGPGWFPQILSEGTPPIGWNALSGLSGDLQDPHRMYAVNDSFLAQSQIYTIDLGRQPARITNAVKLTIDGEPQGFDLEGIAQRTDGSFWLVSEGGRSNADLLILAGADGVVQEQIELPEAVKANQVRFGFEGVAITGSGSSERVYLAFQREWLDDPAGFVKIGEYNPLTGDWSFFYYPLDTPVEGAWAGNSEITSLGNGRLAILERDNQLGEAARLKRIYEIRLGDTRDMGLQYPVFTKTLLRNLLPDLAASNGTVPDKPEGLGVTADGELYLVTDNDGIDDAYGETQFLHLGRVPAADTHTTRFELNVLHINDHHSHLEADHGVNLMLAGESTRVEAGGFPRVVTEFDELAASQTNVLKVHAGDALSGTLYYSLFKGEADAAMMNEVCFDVFELGNHEFDEGDASLRDFLDDLKSGNCDTSVLGANVLPQVGTPLAPDTVNDYIKPYVVKQYGGESVGIIGLDIAYKTKNSSSPLPTTQFLDETETAQKYIDELSGMGIDKILLVTHYQNTNDQILAAHLHGVDVIIGGDSHTLLGNFDRLGLNASGPYPMQLADMEGNLVCVAQAWQYSQIVGELHVGFDDQGRVTSCGGTPHLLLGDTFMRSPTDGGDRVELTGAARQAVLDFIDSTPELSIVTPDAVAQARLDAYSGQVGELETAVIANVNDDLCLERIPGQGRSQLCDVVATASHGGDIQQLVSHAFWSRSFLADIALQNSGGVRIDIPMGQLTIGDAYTLLPFANTMVEIDLTGAEIKASLEEAVEYATTPGGSTGAYPYASGLRWDVDLSQPAGQRFSNLEVKPKGATEWKPLDPEASFKVVVNSFMAQGGDGYATLGAAVADPSRGAVDTLIDYAQGFIDHVQQDLGGLVSKLPVSEYSTQMFTDASGNPQ